MAERLARDVKLIEMNFPEGRDFLRIFKIADLFKKEQPTIVHTHGWGGCSFDGIIGARLARAPIVINGEHGTFFLKRHQVFIQRLLAQLCDANFSVSKSLKDRVTKNLKINPRKITVLQNGVDTDIFNGRYDTTYLKKELNLENITGKKLVLGSIGSLKASKNQEFLLKTLAYLSKQGEEKKIIALFVGEGPRRSFLEKLTKELQLENRVYFLGLRKDIPQILSLVDVLISTSKSEGMSNVTLEAFSSCVPVITSGAVGMAEVVHQGQNGFIFENNNIDMLSQYLKLLYADKLLLKNMGKRAREIALEKYSINHMVHTYEKKYIDLLQKKRIYVH